MRIPTYDGPRATLSDQPLAAPRVPVERGREVLGQALAEGGQAIDRGAAFIARSMREDEAKQEHARQQAIAKESTDGESELTRYATEKFHGRQGSGDPRRDAIESAFTGEEAAPKGYLNMKGDEAFEASQPTFEDLEKKRREIADNMATDEARERFLDRTKGQMDSYFETVERHAGHQRQVANLATLEARKASVLEAVRKNPDNLDAVDTLAHSLNQPIAALALSGEDVKAKALDWHGEVAATQIAAQLDGPGGWRAAEKTFSEKSGILSETARKQLGSTIEKRKATAIALGTADTIAAATTDPTTGRIDQAKAGEMLRSADMEPEARKAAGDRLDHLVIESEKAFGQRVSNTYHSAFATYLRTHDLANVPPETRDWLIDNATERWDELEQKQHRDRERAKKALRGEQGEGETMSEARALLELKSDIVRNPSKYADMSPAEFDAEWGARLSPSGYKTGGSLFANASKGDRLSDDEFSSYVNEQVRTNPVFFANPNNQKEKDAKKHLADGFRADFGDARRSFKDQHKRNPTMSEVQSPEFQKSIWTQTLRRNGVQLGEAPPSATPKPSGLVLPELDFTGDQAAPAMIRVKNKKTGQTGKMPSTKFNPDLYERLDG